MIAALALAALASAASGLAQPADPIEACRCHDAIDPAAKAGVIDLRGWVKDGPHRELGCAACHPAAFGARHEQYAKQDVGCATCHETQGADWDQTIHGRLQGKDARIRGCLTCHSEHPFFEDSDPHGRYTNTGLLFGCTHCHRPMPVDPALDLPLKAAPDGRHWPSSLHGLIAEGDRRFVSACWTCHGAHRVFATADERSAVNPSRIATTCGDCHPGIRSEDVYGRVCRPYRRVSFALTNFFDIWYLWAGSAVALWILCVAGALGLAARLRRRRKGISPGGGRDLSDD